MGRPTIRDLAAAAGVSVATVNRVMGRSVKVSSTTMQRVLEAAQQIGFSGCDAHRFRVADTRPRHRLGVVIQSSHQQFSTVLANKLQAAAGTTEEGEIRLQVIQLNDLSPEQVAVRMLELAEESDALAVVAAEHPIVTHSIERLAAQGVPVVALISSLSARSNVGYVGLDSWKVGRTSAWAFENICKTPGKLGILAGSHRFRCHDLSESSFRSYFREHANAFSLLEPLSTFESDVIAQELTEKLLHEHPDLKGLYVSGGGISGALAAIRAEGKSGKIVVVGHDLMDTTKRGLLDGTLTLVISHPFGTIAHETISAMIRAKQSGPEAGGQSVLVPFELYTRENI